MKRMWTGIVVFAMGCVGSQAATIRITDAANTPVAAKQGSSDVGTLSLTQQTVQNAASGAPLQFTVSDLDLDGVGGNNDSVVVDFQLTVSPGAK